MRRKLFYYPALCLVFLLLLSLGQEPGQAQVYSPTVGVVRSDEINLLARLVAAESKSEPYTGQVGVASVVLNRTQHPAFPGTVAGVIYQPKAFESVSNGLVWRVSPTSAQRRAALDAVNGWDPTYGSIYFWNPAKPVSPWIWTRTIITQIGRHVFAR